MSYPAGLPDAFFCVAEGCRFNGSGVCSQCGDRLRCFCGQFVREDSFDAHIVESHWIPTDVLAELAP